jgi:hypothetical protein
MNNWRSQLNENGYIIINNLIEDKVIDGIKLGIGYNDVNIDMLKYADYMIKKVGNHLDTEIDFLKFRVSNNNNSIDAGGFHRDVVCLKTWRPVMTCLTYFDDTTMEIIEGSHKLRNLTYCESTDLLKNNRKLIKMKAGDILLFYATVLHRGVFTGKVPNRRLIQIFDCFENNNNYINELVSALGKENRNEMMITMNKFKISSEIFSLFSYYNFISGTTEKEDTCFSNKIKYNMISSEGLCKRWKYIPYNGTPQPINKYIMNPNKYIDNILTEKQREKWFYLFYIRQYITYTVSIVFLITIFVMIITWLTVNK